MDNDIEEDNISISDSYPEKEDTNAPTLYECNECRKCYDTVRKLKDHLRKVHSERRCCYLCGKMYGNESNLKRHIDNFHGSKQLVCQYCGNNFKAYNSKYLKLHEIRC